MESKMPYKEPQIDVTSFNCPHCNAYSAMSWGVLKPNTRGSYVDSLKIAYCSHCEKYSLWVGDDIVYPAVVPVELPNQDLPEEIKNDYNEYSS